MNNIDEVKGTFGKEDELFFYFPILPSKERNDSAIDLLTHFPNATMLFEKPSHNCW